MAFASVVETRMLKSVTIECRENGVLKPINSLARTITKNHKADIRGLRKYELIRDEASLLASGDTPTIKLSFYFDPEDENQAAHAKAILETIEKHPLYEKISRIELDVDEADL